MSINQTSCNMLYPVYIYLCVYLYTFVNHGGVVVSKHGLYVGGPGSIPTAITTMTAADGDVEHVSLNH